MKLPPNCFYCRQIAAERQDHDMGVLWRDFGVRRGDVSVMGVSGVGDDGIRMILGFGWKWNLEQTCRCSGNLAASLVFDEVQNKFKELSEPRI